MIRRPSDLLLAPGVLVAATLFYWLAALAAGFVVGVLRPWTRTATGAAATGFVAALPMAVMAVPFLDAKDRSPFPWNFVFIFAAIMGPLGGLILWQVHRR